MAKMVRIVGFHMLTIVAILHTAQLEEIPSDDEIWHPEFLIGRAKTWFDEQTSFKRDTRRQTPSIIPKHLIYDRSNYTYIIRKEYRQMTHEEMDVFHTCLQKMKDKGDYDKLADLHHPDYARAAHFGVAFLPWHRQYLLVCEQIIRAYDGCEDFFIPYWDSCLDEMLPTPSDSAVWTSEYWGTNSGTVTSGRLGRNWHISYRCQQLGLYYKLERHCDEHKSHLYSRNKIGTLFSAHSYTHLLVRDEYVGDFSKFELAHGHVHCFVGTCKPYDTCIGHFACLRCSANDPIFWLLHAFVDSLWDEWASIPGRDNTYPITGRNGATYTNLGKTDHYKYSPMSPFPGLHNIDGFRKNYYPQYTTRPSLIRCWKDEDCGSPSKLLYCHHGYCSAKVRPWGDCSNLPSSACYCSNNKAIPRCLRNRCQCN